MKNHNTLLTTILLVPGFFASVPRAQAVVPPPDGGYPGGNTAEGQQALLSLTTGTYNTAIGWFSLRNNTEGRLNTAIGAGALFANTSAAMLLNESLKEHRKVKELEATVAKQEKGIEAVTVELKDQAAQIRKVNAQIQMKKPTTKVALNKT